MSISVTELKLKILKSLAKDCGFSDPNQCTKPICLCSLAAEYQAFLQTIIPRNFHRLSIKDFDGSVDGKQVLDSAITARAKAQVVKYCWGDLPVDKLPYTGESELNKSSIMSQRIKEGRNVVIYGDPARKVVRKADNKSNFILEMPLGRTLIAALLTKEAIKLRVADKPEIISYEWIEFNSLVRVLKTDEIEASRIESTDWLVVDNITEAHIKSSDKGKSYLQSILDPFFASRLQERLPTIFVFRFDVDSKRDEIEPTFGVSMSKVVNSGSTCKISLTGKKEK